MKTKLLPDDKMKKLNELLRFRQKFGHLEYRIILLAVLQMTWKNEHSKMYPIYIQNVFFEDTKYEYETFKNIVFSLHSYEIDFLDGNEYSIITKSSGSSKNDRMIEIRFHDNIQKFLLDLKTKSTLITIYNAIFLKQDFSVRLYEVLKRYKEEEHAELDLKNLKELYFVDQDEEKDSQNIQSVEEKRIFDISVIEEAVDEINEQCDLYITCEVLADDQKIRFTVKKNEYFLDGRHVEFIEINDRTSTNSTPEF